MNKRETNHSTEIDPTRVCCGQRHHGPVCPDGLVMCCICFRRVARADLHVLEPGDGSDAESAPIYEDVCRTCKKREERWGMSTPPAKCTSCGDTGRTPWMSESDPNCYQEPGADGTVPCIDCSPAGGDDRG